MKKIFMITGIVVLAGLAWYWFKNGKKPISPKNDASELPEVKAAAPAIPLVLGTTPTTPAIEARIIQYMNSLPNPESSLKSLIGNRSDTYALTSNQARALYAIIDLKDDDYIPADYAGTTEAEAAAWCKKYVI